MIQSILKTEIRNETDVVSVRKKARDMAQFLGLDVLTQTRVATSVSEIARNAYEYASGGIVEFRIEESESIKLAIIIKDQGPGIPHLQDIIRGTYVSQQGMGLGLMGAKKLMDEVTIDTKEKQGTTVTLKKIIPGRKLLLSAQDLRLLTDKMMGLSSNDPMAELQRQNQEILVAMAELREKKEELIQINQELEDTNRGVVALYAELDEKAEILRRANESKTSFLADMTHEFRSPLNSILGISQILLTESRRELDPEREKQVNFIIKAAKGLSDLVNDLLDIAKIEAGKISVKTSSFYVNDIMSTLRGLMRPIAGHEKVHLNFETINNVLLNTDEAKLTQILRNFISNSLKYTEEGEIIVSARQEGELVVFKVKDTGIGIPEKDQERIFEEFYQVDHAGQSKSKGTGLGLPLSKKLSRLIGGEITVVSEPGKGSEFILKIPANFTGPSETLYEPKPAQKSPHVMPSRKKVLVVDDDESIRYLIRSVLADLQVDYREAENGQQGLEIAKIYLPDLVILDLVMPEKDGFQFIRGAMELVATRHTPILLHTSKTLDYEERIYLEQVTSGIVTKKDGEVKDLKEAVKTILGIL